MGITERDRQVLWAWEIVMSKYYGHHRPWGTSIIPTRDRKRQVSWPSHTVTHKPLWAWGTVMDNYHGHHRPWQTSILGMSDRKGQLFWAWRIGRGKIMGITDRDGQALWSWGTVREKYYGHHTPWPTSIMSISDHKAQISCASQTVRDNLY